MDLTQPSSIYESIFSVIAFLTVMALLALFIAHKKHVPYRIILKSDGIWVLQFKSNIFDVWVDVFRSSNKAEVKTKAKEALCAYSKFTDFIHS